MKKLLIILLVFQPFLVKLAHKFGMGLNFIGELLSVFVLIAFLILTLKKKRINAMFIVFLILITYMICLAIFRGLIPFGLIQVIIYSQAFFYFFYFNGLTDQNKIDLIISVKKIFEVILIIIGLLTLLEFYDHIAFKQAMGLYLSNRGFNGFYLVSFFGSGPSLSMFLSLYVFIWHYYHYGFGFKVTRKDKRFLVFSIIIAILSFSRKEILFIFLFLVFFPYPSKSKLNKWVKRIMFFTGVFSFLLIYYLTFFEHVNESVTGDKYVRWQIIEKGYEVYSDYFPLGSGPGTFGSKMSLSMPHIYDKYDVGQNILGWERINSRGPIYDAFLFTLTTEIGVGILILLFFFYKLLRTSSTIKNVYSNFCKNFLIIYILVLSLVTPLLTISLGFLMMVLIACFINPPSLLNINKISR